MSPSEALRVGEGTGTGSEDEGDEGALRVDEGEEGIYPGRSSRGIA